MIRMPVVVTVVTNDPMIWTVLHSHALIHVKVLQPNERRETITYQPVSNGLISGLKYPEISFGTRLAENFPPMLFGKMTNQQEFVHCDCLEG